MKKQLLTTTIAAIAATSANAGTMRTAECRSEIAECYSTMQSACPAGFSIIDRNSHYGDAFVSELPPGFIMGLSSQYNTYIYQCR
jgi:hypothetical protein